MLSIIHLISCHVNNGFIAGCEDAEAAELEVLLQALLYATNRKLSNIIFVSNCLRIVNFIKGNDSCILWMNYHLAQKCPILYRKLLISTVGIFWISRELNEVAHVQALYRVI